MRFGEDSFDNVAVVKLERNSKWHRIFNGNLDARGIRADLKIVLKQKILPGRTLLFISRCF